MGDAGADEADLSSVAFTPVGPKKRRKNKNKGKAIPNPPNPSILLQLIRDQMREDDWLIDSYRVIDDAINGIPFPFTEILCLGLGSPSSSLNARVQLGFLLELCHHYHIERTKVFLYDPVFTEEDIKLLEALEIRPLTENRNAAYSLIVPTMCFMPHCDLDLYENILKANWDQERLPNLLLLANQLADYVESNPAHKLEIRAPRVLRLAPLLDCRLIPTCDRWPAAFNNTSIQSITRATHATEAVWSRLFSSVVIDSERI